MIKRSIYIGQAAKISLQNKQFKMELADEQVKSIPVEDLGIVVLDHPQIVVTQGIVNALAQNNCAVLWCDEKHLPNTLSLPMQANSIHTQILRRQLKASVPLNKHLWKQIIKAKINNQAKTLQQQGHDASNLEFWSKQVISGDKQNLEARASAYYWEQILGKYGVNRGRFEDAPNQYFNYGYAILRSVAARALVSSGLLCAKGIFHRNKYNPFCLADDVMEPFRPMVDLHVLKLLEGKSWEELNFDINKEEKAHLLGIPILDVQMDGKQRPLLVAMQQCTASLVKCYTGTDKTLQLPSM